ncbi:Putative zn(2)-C6 fungal-type DNA-binding domain-containing protein [Septoria linicola]|uniref:Zn(2)-C6 fungal-type DNA-binding domain-containing protein n=1 Tax=Septoria linicola TaxID=215465 RepID=A0A9Q9AIT0_9PEZI|nr:putative zn(2)-C6 fungal-type DNA-binding domain-containing protein [Septoria linicola]USW49820.1 Putative zn(2)-C6 fungal-type DNA-binding domain-containing protein [Septoria linicola]
MDLGRMLSNGTQNTASTGDTRRQNHNQSTRNGIAGSEAPQDTRHHAGNTHRLLRGQHAATASSGPARGSPAKRDQKHVVFRLIDQKDPRIQARLPMRVMISPRDTTESIITTVKNFYGLYDYGVSFENEEGISIIAAPDNFDNDMNVYVRTVAPPPLPASETARDSASPKKLTLGAPFEMRPPTQSNAHSPSRSAARSAGLRSVSPQSELGRRSASVAPGGKPKTHRTKSRDHSQMGDNDGYSSADNDNGSVASSRRSKAEEIKADITVDNIVEGGRRKRAFESSELPLFVPPQVPMSASISSISPQRRSGPNMASPYAYSNQQTFSYQQPLPSPQSYNNGFGSMQPPFSTNTYQGGFQQPSRQLRGSRHSGASYSSHRNSNGVLPTPDPTIGSVISDEDVALQLMRLGDPTAFSHGRTSTSTIDDALSGKADAASSEEDSEEEGDDDGETKLPAVPAFSKEDVGPARKKQRIMNELPSDGTSGEEYEDHRDGNFGSDEMDIDGQRQLSKAKSKVRKEGSMSMGKVTKPRQLSVSSKSKKPSVGNIKVPMSPASLPSQSQSRKASVASTINFQHQLGVDEEDLSSKPRCQRCRKSKKGCDRQRPCGRCKDAGIGIEGCVSEDEGNGRKGRYGRHMGVTIKKGEGESAVEDMSPPPPHHMHGMKGSFLAPAILNVDKKRKR